MKANRMWLFSDVLEKNKRVFRVPVYQRNYDWTNIQCEKLFLDILEANKKNCQHFIGTVVYIDDVNGGSGLNEVLIIDGQQRITTIYILLKALYNASKDVSFHIEREIEEVMFNRHCDEMYKIKLKPVKTDNEQLMYMIKDRIEMMDRNSNVYKNYIIFEKLIDEHLKSGLEINDILNGIKKLEVVEIILDKSLGDEPQKIFESINSTGLDLSLADLIRNYLLMDNINQEALYEEYWLEIEKNVGYKNLGDFVINYLNSQISKSVNEKNAYHLFKKHCIENNLTCEDILKSLKRTSKYYGAFIGENKYYSAELTKYLSAFNTIKQTTVLPLLFKIFNDYEDNRINEESLSKVLNYLLTYLIRITACEISKNLSKFMKSMYDRVIDGKYNNYYERFVIFLNDLRANDRMPTDKEFRDALISKPLYKKNICKYLLSVIENSTKEHIDVSNLTIEHILPQKENAAVWRKEIGEDYDSVYDLYLHTLGNLTITGHNSELGTKSFNDKKKIIKDNSKANILNKDVLSVDRWNKTSILNRANNLIDILLDEFKYVEIHSNKNVKNELGYDLNSDIDFSNTKPIAFSFDGEFIKVNNWVDLLTKFIGIAYDLDTVLFVNLAKQNYSIPNATRVYISNDNRKLRKPKEIENSGIYFEANLSSNRVLSFIKFLLLEMGIDIDKFSFELSEGVFDLNDEASWAEGIISVAKLFYNLVENLIALSKISSDEIEKLKTKEYTKSLFPLTDYPAIANNINDNMGNSTRKRYRSQSLNFNGVEIYISTQFFENDREAIIEWYKKH
ncbi:MAG: DUF262 domain-containing HNH endonuclease family protein [Veillonella sp.]|uniref:DUF262 domain-containing protein n=1 Tax=Veillonella sp. TaxID=1926307 RepID=UPI002912BDC0|nr:DUF262 domain-containing HNH endonuclease family protein [Veillonella sp.]MDU5763343.1 DUF262 domain-containing HNH endonuclease family protein [Veillonella sp.]